MITLPQFLIDDGVEYLGPDPHTNLKGSALLKFSRSYIRISERLLRKEHEEFCREWWAKMKPQYLEYERRYYNDSPPA